MLPLEGNDRLSSSSKGRVRENFLINQQMSTFTLEIRIESAESASVPRCLSMTSIMLVDYIDFLLEGLNWENPNFSPFMDTSIYYFKRGSAYFGGALGSAVLHKKRLRNGST